MRAKNSAAPAGSDRGQACQRVVALHAIGRAGGLAHSPPPRDLGRRGGQELRQAVDVAGAERHEQVSVAEPAAQNGGGFLDRGQPPDRLPSGLIGGRVGHELAGHARIVRRLFAGAVHVEDHDLVGAGKRPAELPVHVQGARVQVRLEGGDQTARRELPRRPQSRLDLGRMMRVVVEDARAGALPARLEPATRGLEGLQRRGGSPRIAARGLGGRHRRQGVEHVVVAGHGQPHAPRLHPAARDGELAALVGVPDVAGGVFIGAACLHAVSDQAPPRRRMGRHLVPDDRRSVLAHDRPGTARTPARGRPAPGRSCGGRARYS